MPAADTAKLLAVLNLKDGLTPVVRTVSKSLDKLDARLDKSQGRAYLAGQQIGTGIKNSAKLIAGVGVAAATTGAVIFADSIKKASDLNETLSKTTVVFGQNADAVKAFGKTSADALGLSEDAALSAASQYGNLFVSMGLSAKQAATMSTKLVTLASDLASFNNIDPSEAADKLRSGLVGESEPLRELGINISEQILKNKALELGLVKLAKGQKNYTAVLTPSQKALAAYALIFEQSKTAQGDFQRTQSGLANQQRKFAANWENLQATLAMSALPGIAKIMERINKLMRDNQPTIAALGDNIAGLFSDQNIETGAKLISDVFNAAKDAAPILADAAKKVGYVVSTSVGLFRSLPPELQAILVGGVALNKLTGGLVTNVAGGLAGGLSKALGGILGGLTARGATPANPVFVSSVGGLGGVPTPGGGIGTLGKAALLGEAVLLAGLVEGVRESESNRRSEQGSQIHQDLQKMLSQNPSEADLRNALGGVEQGIKDIQGNPLAVLVQGSALDELQSMRSELQAALARQAANTPAVTAAQNASESEIMTKRAAFSSVPTNKELRAKIAELVREQKGAPPKQARAIGKEISSIQHRLEKRMTEQRQKIEAQTVALSREIRGVSDTIRSSQPVINVPVTTQTVINGRLVTANFSRYTSVVGGKVVNATSGSGV